MTIKAQNQSLTAKLFAQIRRLLNLELVKYGISGVIAFVCDFLVLVAVTELLGVHYLLSNIPGYLTGIVVSYQLNIRYVFEHRRFAHKQHHEFVFFSVIALTGLLVSELAMFVITEFVDLPYTWAKVYSVFFVFAFNYIAKKLFLFRP